MAEKGGDADISAAYANLAAHAKVYTCFSEELSAGYAERVDQRDLWLAEIEEASLQKEMEEREKEKRAITAPTRHIQFGVATTHKRRAGWPAGGMHEHGW
mmetsp:Transcript_24412/g.39136  ORF Transcript_24412/g.39136 Transcript_24412/m.39136 type:complete len:100 (+) Transcript_24412:38-337(+)